MRLELEESEVVAIIEEHVKHALVNWIHAGDQIRVSGKSYYSLGAIVEIERKEQPEEK